MNIPDIALASSIYQAATLVATATAKSPAPLATIPATIPVDTQLELPLTEAAQ